MITAGFRPELLALRWICNHTHSGAFPRAAQEGTSAGISRVKVPVMPPPPWRVSLAYFPPSLPMFVIIPESSGLSTPAEAGVEKAVELREPTAMATAAAA